MILFRLRINSACGELNGNKEEEELLNYGSFNINRIYSSTIRFQRCR